MKCFPRIKNWRTRLGDCIATGRLFLRQTGETTLTFLYPAQCRVCDTPLGLEAVPYFCQECWQKIQFVERPWCEICGIPHPDKRATASVCDKCAGAPPRYGKLRTIAFYEEPFQQVLHLFKFGKRTGLASPLIQLMLARLPDDCRIEDYDFILPIPIHKKRLRERGFNQSLLLAEGIAKAKGMPVATDILIRQKHTKAQSSLTGRAARQENITDAFELRNPKAAFGKRFLLIDDVFTTGATVQEAVKELWKADPAEIDVLTLARTPSADTP